MVCVSAALVSVGTYGRKETVRGFLTSTIGVAKVVPPRAGLIVNVAVAEGQLVEAGAALLTVQVGQTDDRGGDVDDTVRQSLQRQRTALIDQIALERTKSATDREQLEHRIEGLGRELQALLSQLVSQRQRTQVADEQVTAITDLVRQGYVSVVEFKRRQDNLLAQRQQEAALVRQIAENRGAATQQEDALGQIHDTLAARIAVLRGSIADIEGRVAEIGGRRAYQLRAPIAGHVSALQARVGQAADPAIPLLSVVPAGSILQAELLVPARAIGFVEPGQGVRLAYDAFPFQRFGLHTGYVTTVSRNLLRPAELIAPIAVTEPSYRVTVALQQQNVTAFGREFPLGTDMILKADIVFDRRSLLEWLFEPLFSLRGRWS
jgi:membrane fusion protein